MYKRQLTARAATRVIVNKEMADCTNINILAKWVSGITSVGLNAVAFVNATYR